MGEETDSSLKGPLGEPLSASERRALIAVGFLSPRHEGIARVLRVLTEQSTVSFAEASMWIRCHVIQEMGDKTALDLIDAGKVESVLEHLASPSSSLNR